MIERAQRGSVFLLGTYLLGVVTTLALLHFDEIPRLGQTLLVVSLLLLVGVALLLATRQHEPERAESPDVDSADPPPEEVLTGQRVQLNRQDSGDRHPQTDDKVGDAPQATPALGPSVTQDLLESQTKRQSPLKVGASTSTRTVEQIRSGRSYSPARTAPPKSASTESDLTESARADPGQPERGLVQEPQISKPELRQEDLIQLWQDYWREGDGHFNSSGLRSQLSNHGLDAEVIEGAEIGAGDSLLIVDPKSCSQHLYLLPSFTKSPRAVREWFDDQSDGALTSKTRKVLELAVIGRTGTGFEIISRGIVS